MKGTNIFKGIQLSVLCAGMMVGSQAMAGDYEFSFNKNDLRTSSGVESVHKDIAKAAKDYCPRYVELRSTREISNCRKEVTSDLIAKIDNPQLTAYHNGYVTERVATR